MELYLGFDCSTQGMKAVLIDVAAGAIAGVFAVNFGRDLPEYRSPGGFLENPDPLVYQADPVMWAAALDLLLTRMREAGAPLARVAGISGSGQQHGSVYCNAEFARTIGRLWQSQSLAVQLKDAFSRPLSPIWMDRSSAAACRELAKEFGDEIREVTGSPPTERFTGPQIRKFAGEQPAAYARTERIHLVSSYLCSLLTGVSAPIDYGDGAGMNLLNLRTMKWDEKITAFTAPGLLKKLPPAVASATSAGELAGYFGKYGLRPGIPVIVWSGDNPCSLIGVGGSAPGTAVISLGTSDTFFAAMRAYRVDPEGCGHVFGNPAGGFMSLICFTNGSPAREQMRDKCGMSWEEFDRPCGNAASGRLMLPYFAPESTPPVLQPGVRFNFNPAGASADELVQALLESQALSLRLHSRWQQEDFRCIRLTGGASCSRRFRRILADVFQSEIESIALADSAALGAALRAANAVSGIPFERLYADFCRPAERVSPNPSAAAGYDRLLEAYRELENTRR